MTELYCYPIPFDHDDQNIALLNQGLNKWKLESKSEDIQEQYITDFINHKISNEKSKCAFLEIAENIYEWESLGMEQRQPRVFPADSDWISIPDRDYEKYLTHHTKLFKSYHSGSASGMKEIPSMKSRRRFLNFGRRVKYLSWSPKLSSENQVLIGVATDDPMEMQFKLELTPEPNNDLIQVWECGNVWERSDGPKLAYGLVHNWGHIISAKWVSPDEINMTIVNHSEFIKGSRQPLHGHIMFCCSDGYIRIVPIPKFSEMEICSMLQNAPETSEIPILLMKSDIILKLGLGSLYINDDRVKFGYPTSVDWKSKFVDKVVAGFSKGYVGVYDLSVVHHMRYDSTHHYLTPTFKRRVSYAAVTAVCFSSFEWKTFNVTVAANSYPQTNFTMKMTSRHAPSDILKLSEPPNSVVWTSSSDIFVCVPSNCDSLKILSLLCQSVTTIPISKINCISYCESLNTILVGTQSGSVLTLALNNRSIMQAILNIDVNQDLHDLAKCIRHYRSVNKNAKGNNFQMLVDCESQADVLQLYDDVPFVTYPSITQIATNPNITAVGFAAVVFDSGIVHLMNFADQELTELMRDISLFSLNTEQQNELFIPPKLPVRENRRKRIGETSSNPGTSAGGMEKGKRGRKSKLQTEKEQAAAAVAKNKASGGSSMDKNKHDIDYLNLDDDENLEKMMEETRQNVETANALYPLRHLNAESSSGPGDECGGHSVISTTVGSASGSILTASAAQGGVGGNRPGTNSGQFGLYYDDEYDVNYMFDKRRKEETITTEIVDMGKDGGHELEYEEVPVESYMDYTGSQQQHHRSFIHQQLPQQQQASLFSGKVQMSQLTGGLVSQKGVRIVSTTKQTGQVLETANTRSGGGIIISSTTSTSSSCPVRMIKKPDLSLTSGLAGSSRTSPIKVISASGGHKIKIIPKMPPTKTIVSSGDKAPVGPISFHSDADVEASVEIVTSGYCNEEDDYAEIEKHHGDMRMSKKTGMVVDREERMAHKSAGDSGGLSIVAASGVELWWHSRRVVLDILVPRESDSDSNTLRREVAGHLVLDEPAVNNVVKVRYPDVSSRIEKAFVINIY